MAQNRVDLADALIKDLEYVFEKHTINDVTYRQRASVDTSGLPTPINNKIVIAPVTVIPDDVGADNLVVAYNFADQGPYNEDVYFGGNANNNPLRSMGVDVAVGSKEYRHILAAGDWLIDYFDGADTELGRGGDSTFKTVSITFDGETQPDMITEGDRVITASYNFNIIYDRGQ